MGITFPGESAEYRAARDRLLEEEIELRRAGWSGIPRDPDEFWGSELLYAPADPGQDPRHVGTIEPLWNLYGLTPAGRGTGWDEQLSY